MISHQRKKYQVLGNNPGPRRVFLTPLMCTISYVSVSPIRHEQDRCLEGRYLLRGCSEFCDRTERCYSPRATFGCIRMLGKSHRSEGNASFGSSRTGGPQIFAYISDFRKLAPLLIFNGFESMGHNVGICLTRSSEL